MTEKLLRVRVYEDDPEMVAIYDAYRQTREHSRAVRGSARRGAESEFMRRLLIAGFRQMYGEFPRPGAPAAPRVGDLRQQTPVTDIPMQVVNDAVAGSNAAGEAIAPPAQAEKKPPRVDLTGLLAPGTGNRASNNQTEHS